MKSALSLAQLWISKDLEASPKTSALDSRRYVVRSSTVFETSTKPLAALLLSFRTKIRQIVSTESPSLHLSSLGRLNSASTLLIHLRT